MKYQSKLTHEDCCGIAEAIKAGDVKSAREIVEKAGLTWLTSSVKKSHLEQCGESVTLLNLK